jgi:hypothetical protein
MMWRTVTFALPAIGILAFALPCTAETAWPVLLRDGDTILFIGNSYVGSEGGLENHFRRTVAKAVPPLTVKAYWPAMYDKAALAEMYTDEVAQWIPTGDAGIVVIQSGANAAMQRFADLVKGSGRQLIILGTWADNPALADGGWDAFRSATQADAERVRAFEKQGGAPVVPCGLIYYDLLADPPPFDGLRPDFLFVPGSSIQNDLGTLVNVAALYAVTTGRSPVGLPCWEPFPDSLVRAVEERVWRIVQDWKAGKVKLKAAPRHLPPRPALHMEGAGDQPAWPAILNDGDRIFYVGNSFIGNEGGLDNVLRRLVARAVPPLTITNSSQIFWGRGLGSMYTDDVLQEIRSGRDNVVVVTSGPADLLKQFHDEITRAGGRMMVHMTWGRNPTINDGGMASFREQTVRIVDQMQQFGRDTGVPVAPCGLVFYDLIVDPPDVAGLRPDWIFMSENIHQNQIGTMANAATHYAVMTGRSPVGLPMWDPYPPELVKAVHERAWRIVQDWRAGKVVVKPVRQ